MKLYAHMFVLSLAMLPALGHCMSLKVYEKVQSQTTSSVAMEKYVSQATLMGYFQALADALTTMQHDGRLVLPNASNSPTLVCVPSSVKIDRHLVQLATDKEIQEHIKTYQSSNPNNWQELNLVTFAYIGLSRMFPCKAP